VLGYTGQYTDSETGFIYLRARYLDPTTGQFTSKDPFVALTHEPYGYATSNPVMRTDPSGLCGLMDPGSCFEGAGDWLQGAGECASDLPGCIAGDAPPDPSPAGQATSRARVAAAEATQAAGEDLQGASRSAYVDARVCPAFGCIGVTISDTYGVDCQVGVGQAYDAGVSISPGQPNQADRTEFWGGAGWRGSAAEVRSQEHQMPQVETAQVRRRTTWVWGRCPCPSAL
jgi:RHS repeat-associated protein